MALEEEPGPGACQASALMPGQTPGPKIGFGQLFPTLHLPPSFFPSSSFLCPSPRLTSVSVSSVAVVVTRHKSKELSRKQSQQLELLESELRKEIRDGKL